MTREDAIRKIKKRKLDPDVMEILSAVIPELAESDDERIGNLIYCIVRDREDVRDTLEANGVSVDNALAYLERQKDTDEARIRARMRVEYEKGRADAIVEMRNLTPEEKMNHPLYLEGFDVGRRVGEVVKERKCPNWMPKFLDKLRSKKNYFDWDEHRDIEGGILAIINWIAPNYFKGKEKELEPEERSEQRSKQNGGGNEKM